MDWEQIGHHSVIGTHAASGRSSNIPPETILMAGSSSGKVPKRRGRPRLSRKKKSSSNFKQPPPVALNDAGILLLDISDRLPYCAVESSSSKVWQDFGRDVANCTTAHEVLEQAQWFLKQIKQIVVRGDWSAEQSTAWQEECERCETILGCFQLVQQLENEIIDWDAVASSWVLERGYEIRSPQADLHGKNVNMAQSSSGSDEASDVEEGHTWQESRVSADGGTSRVCTLWPKRRGVPVLMQDTVWKLNVQIMLSVAQEQGNDAISPQRSPQFGPVSPEIVPVSPGHRISRAVPLHGNDFVMWSHLDVEEDIGARAVASAENRRRGTPEPERDRELPSADSTLPSSFLPQSFHFHPNGAGAGGHASSVFEKDADVSVAADVEGEFVQDTFEQNLTSLLWR